MKGNLGHTTVVTVGQTDDGLKISKTKPKRDLVISIGAITFIYW